MRIAFFVNRRMPHHIRFAEAFEAGLARHDIRVSLRDRDDDEGCDLAVMWSVKAGHVMARQRQRGRDFLILERGYFDRETHTAFCFNGLHGRGEWAAAPDFERFRALGVPILPWQVRPDGYALILGQVPGDASHAHTDVEAWYRVTAARLRELGHDVRLRDHPLGRARIALPRTNGTLAQDLGGARLAVSFCSNAAVEAILAGVPTVAADPGSPAAAVAMAEIREHFELCERREWAATLAANQFTLEEIASGHAWDRVKCRYS